MKTNFCEGVKIHGEYCGIPYQGIITATRFAPGRGYIHTIDFTPPIKVPGFTGKPDETRESSEIHVHPDYPNGRDGNTIFLLDDEWLKEFNKDMDIWESCTLNQCGD